MSNDFAASVRARLLNIAKSQGVDFNLVLVRFALERMLYRLSQSPHAEHFVLKGALLFTLWYDMPHRATRDADMLGFGASDLASIGKTFRDIVGVDVDDGITFDQTLASAVAATFARRGMPVPASPPVGLTDEFATYPSRQAVWHAFLGKNDLTWQALPGTVAALRTVLEPVLLRASALTDHRR